MTPHDTCAPAGPLPAMGTMRAMSENRPLHQDVVRTLLRHPPLSALSLSNVRWIDQVLHGTSFFSSHAPQALARPRVFPSGKSPRAAKYLLQNLHFDKEIYYLFLIFCSS